MYWGLRVIGFAPDTSYQIWMMGLATLNFIAMYLLLKRYLRFGTIVSSIASLLFAFNTAQINKLVHQPLVPQFYILVSIMALFTIFSTDDRRKRCIAFMVFSLAWVCQFYTGFYTTFMIGLMFVAAFVWAFVFPESRRKIIHIMRFNYLAVALTVLIAVLALWPAMSHYHAIVEQLGWRVPVGGANPYNWFCVSQTNILYGGLQRGLFPHTRFTPEWTQGIGYLTLVLAAIGLCKMRSRLPIRIMVFALLTTLILTTNLTKQLGLWVYVKEVIPGAKALREMSRIGMVQLIPAAIGLGFFFQSLVKRRRWVLLVLLACFCLMEQANRQSKTISKFPLRKEIASIAQQVDPESKAFYLVFSPTRYHAKKGRPKTPELALWTTLYTGKPTVNGRYGNRPPKYPKLLRGPRTLEMAADSLQEWSQLHGIKTEDIQIIEVD